MAIFRQIYNTFWEDTFIEECTPKQKLIYLYILTNSQTTLSGVYEITTRKIAYQTGYSVDEVQEVINYLVKHKKIKYSVENKEILVINWLKYQQYLKSAKSIAALEKELVNIKTHEFELEVITMCQKLQYPIKNIRYKYGIDTVSDTVCKGYGYTNTNTNTKTNTNINTNTALSINTNNNYISAYDEFVTFCHANVSDADLDTDLKSLSSNFKNHLEYFSDINMLFEAVRRSNDAGYGLRYANGILKNWRKTGVLTLEQAKEEREEHEKKYLSRQPQKKKITLTQEEKDAMNDVDIPVDQEEWQSIFDRGVVWQTKS